jgi:hypothetical protein
MENKILEVGKNYGSIFGLDEKKSNKMVFLGGIKWRAEKPGLTKEMDSEITTKNALEYINRPSVHMGW